MQENESYFYVFYVQFDSNRQIISCTIKLIVKILMLIANTCIALWQLQCVRHCCMASLIAQLVKNPPARQETLVQFLGQEDTLEKGQATHSSILGLPLRLSWQRLSLQCGRPGFDPQVGKIPWRRERLPTSVYWPGEFHGLYSPRGLKESDMTE